MHAPLACLVCLLLVEGGRRQAGGWDELRRRYGLQAVENTQKRRLDQVVDLTFIQQKTPVLTLF
jgi:hypothetical protein